LRAGHSVTHGRSPTEPVITLLVLYA
jgi:hypothetical protein